MKDKMQFIAGQKVHGTSKSLYEAYTSQLRMNEYLLVLSPHEELRNKIIQVKKDFHEMYQSSNALGGRPHVALVRFSQLEMLEERIVNRLKLVAMGQYPFKVELKDFGHFPSHTIFINVVTREPIVQLVKTIRASQRLLKADNDHKPYFMDEPMITIARKLLPWQYEKGSLEYTSRHFTGRFVADSMLLLKRRVGDKAYQIAQRFEFMNLPVSTRQGELFV